MYPLKERAQSTQDKYDGQRRKTSLKISRIIMICTYGWQYNTGRAREFSKPTRIETFIDNWSLIYDNGHDRSIQTGRTTQK
jgi:hypothetical protein